MKVSAKLKIGNFQITKKSVTKPKIILCKKLAIPPEKIKIIAKSDQKFFSINFLQKKIKSSNKTPEKKICNIVGKGIESAKLKFLVL